METIIKKAIEGGGFTMRSNYYKSIDKLVSLEYIYGTVAIMKDISGYKHRVHFEEILMSGDFFQALGKACPKIGTHDAWYITDCDCGGVDFHIAGHDAHYERCKRREAARGWLFTGKRFHEINLTESFESAVEWFNKLIK